MELISGTRSGQFCRFVVYFDQQMGAPHAVCWSKSFVSALKQAFWYSLSQMEKKKENI